MRTPPERYGPSSFLSVTKMTSKIFRVDLRLDWHKFVLVAEMLGVVSPHLPFGKKFLRFCLV